MGQTNGKDSQAKGPSLRERSGSNLDPAVPAFIPNPNAPAYVDRDASKNEFNPQVRHQEQGASQYFNQQLHVPENHDRFPTFAPRPHPQSELRKPQQSHHRFGPSKQAVGAAFQEAYDSKGPKPLIEVHAKEPQTQKRIKQGGRAAVWREKKAFEDTQKAQMTDPNFAFYEMEFTGSYPEAPEITASSFDESEWKFEEPLPLKTHPAPGFCREDGTWVNVETIRDDGRDRAAYELQHRVGLNRQQTRSRWAPIKPIARLFFEEVQQQWFSNDRPVVRLNESMSGYAQRVAEMSEMSEEDLELLMRDREIGVKVRELALVYQGVKFM